MRVKINNPPNSLESVERRHLHLHVYVRPVSGGASGDEGHAACCLQLWFCPSCGQNHREPIEAFLIIFAITLASFGSGSWERNLLSAGGPSCTGDI